jgi:hypothetical protein
LKPLEAGAASRKVDRRSAQRQIEGDMMAIPVHVEAWLPFWQIANDEAVAERDVTRRR